MSMMDAESGGAESNAGFELEDLEYSPAVAGALEAAPGQQSIKQEIFFSDRVIPPV